MDVPGKERRRGRQNIKINYGIDEVQMVSFEDISVLFSNLSII